MPVAEPWKNKEEQRTISGYVDVDTYDPICDNCFTLYDSVIEKRQYQPRLGHIGYVKGIQNCPKTELLQFHETLDFNLAWPTRYLLP
jgi:hypothetical protein